MQAGGLKKNHIHNPQYECCTYSKTFFKKLSEPKNKTAKQSEWVYSNRAVISSSHKPNRELVTNQTENQFYRLHTCSLCPNLQANTLEGLEFCTNTPTHNNKQTPTLSVLISPTFTDTVFREGVEEWLTFLMMSRKSEEGHDCVTFGKCATSNRRRQKRWKAFHGKSRLGSCSLFRLNLRHPAGSFYYFARSGIQDTKQYCACSHYDLLISGP